MIQFLVLYLALQSPQEQLREAIRLHQAGQAEAAIPLYEQFLEKRPEVAEIRSNLGAAYAAVGRYADAQKQYELALAKGKNDARIRLNLALVLYKQNRIVDAAEELEKVLAAQGSNAQATTLLADCYLSMGETKKVIALLAPGGAESLADSYILGLAYFREGDARRGQLLVDRVLREGDSPEALYLLATTQMAGEDNKAALVTLEGAIAKHAGFRGLHSLYGQAKLRDGNPEEARAAFEKELAGNPLDFEANLYLGGLARVEKDYEKAALYLGRAAQLRPLSLAVRYQVAYLAFGQGKLEEAREELEKVVAADPNWVEPHITLATVYFRLKRSADGQRMQARVRELNEQQQQKDLKKK